MADATTTPKAIDLLSVKSRVSWGAIAAGAMIALAIYLILTLLGTALSLEVAVRGRNIDLQMGAAIYSIVSLLLAMFFGGWATSRLAVGESKLEAVLYGIILWGVLFTGLIWMFQRGRQPGLRGDCRRRLRRLLRPRGGCGRRPGRRRPQAVGRR